MVTSLIAAWTDRKAIKKKLEDLSNDIEDLSKDIARGKVAQRDVNKSMQEELAAKVAELQAVVENARADTAQRINTLHGYVDETRASTQKEISAIREAHLEDLRDNGKAWNEAQRMLGRIEQYLNIPNQPTGRSSSPHIDHQSKRR